MDAFLWYYIKDVQLYDEDEVISVDLPEKKAIRADEKNTST